MRSAIKLSIRRISASQTFLIQSARRGQRGFRQSLHPARLGRYRTDGCNMLFLVYLTPETSRPSYFGLMNRGRGRMHAFADIGTLPPPRITNSRKRCSSGFRRWSTITRRISHAPMSSSARSAARAEIILCSELPISIMTGTRPNGTPCTARTAGTSCGGNSRASAAGEPRFSETR